MKLVCISDTHSMHRRIPEIPDGDVLIHAGDCLGQGTLEIIQWMAQLTPSKWTRRYGWMDPDFLMTLYPLTSSELGLDPPSSEHLAPGLPSCCEPRGLRVETRSSAGSRAARAARMVSAMRIRAEIEYGEAATDAASLRELELGCMGGRDRLQLT